MILPDDFVRRMKNLLAGEYDAYERSLAAAPVRAVKVNTDKISVENFVRNCPFALRPSGFSADCFIVADDAKIGRTPFHHGGAIYVQEPGAMLPVIAAALKGGETVLDLCAAPGGKTVQAAGKARLVIANDVDYARAKILAGNVERMGLRNVAVCSARPEKLSRQFAGCFDVVIVDAPCSGEGMFRKESAALSHWSEANVRGCAARQREILQSADQMLKEGGKLVYSTCTFSTEENEEIVAYLVNQVGYELCAPDAAVLPYSRSGVEIGGLNALNMRRVYPHDGVGEGQFFAVLRKTDAPQKRLWPTFRPKRADNVSLYRRFCEQNLTTVPPAVQFGDVFALPADNFDPASFLSTGVRMGTIEFSRFDPAHNLFSAMWRDVMRSEDVDLVRAERYLRGEEIEGGGSGWVAVTYLGVPLGGGKASGGVIKNHYPKGLRNK